MPNPYAVTESTSANAPRRRSVSLLIAAAALSGISAFPPLAAGLVLLNQELSIVPASHMVYDIEISGATVSNRTFICASMLIGVLLVSIAMLLLLHAGQNHRHNKSLTHADIEARS